MATVVDALVVTLGLDPTAFKRGKAEASQATKKLTAEETRAAKEIEERNKRAAESFKQFRSEVLALVGLFATGLGIKGLAGFTADTIKGAVATGQLSRELGMVPGQLRAVEQSFDRLGASVGEADDALKGIREQSAKLMTGEMDTRLREYLQNASLAGLKPGEVNVEDVDDPIKKLKKDAEIAGRLAQRFGMPRAIELMKREGYSDHMGAALTRGPEALRAEMERQQKLNELSEQETDRLRALSNRWKDFKEGIGNTMQRAVIAMAPAFETIVGLLERVSSWFSNHADQIGAQVSEMAQQFAAWVTSINWSQVIADVKSFFEELDKGVQALGGWKVVLMALLGLKILSMVSPVLQLAGALGSVGASLGAIAAVGVPAALAWLAAHSEDLNKGEDQYLKKHPAQAGQPWGGDPAGDVRRAANAPNAPLAQRQQYVMGRLKGAGYSDAQAAGMVGSLMQESQLDPRAVNKSSGATGIAQWLGPRARQFERQFGHKLAQSTMGEQVDFMLWELKNTESKADKYIRMARTPEQAANIHAHEYERPGAAEANIARRQAYAQQLYAGIGRANAAQIAQQTTFAPAAAAPAQTAPTSTSTSETNINGPINVYTQATDAAGIARDFALAVQRQSMVTQANTGLN